MSWGGAEVGGMNSVGHQQLAIPFGSAVKLTLPLNQAGQPLRCTHAIIYVQAQDIRWRADGVAPTAAIGCPQAVGDVLNLMDVHADYFGMLTKIQFTAQTVTASIDVEYFE